MTTIRMRRRAIASIRQEINCYHMQATEEDYALKHRLEQIYRDRAMVKAELLYIIDSMSFDRYQQLTNIIDKMLEI